MWRFLSSNTAVVMLRSAELHQICRDPQEFSETVVVNVSKEGLNFSVLGDIGIGNVSLKPRI